MKTQLKEGHIRLTLGVLVFLLVLIATTAVEVAFRGTETIVGIIAGVQMLLFGGFMLSAGFFFGAIAYSDKPRVRKWLAANLPRKDREWLGAERTDCEAHRIDHNGTDRKVDTEAGSGPNLG